MKNIAKFEMSPTNFFTSHCEAHSNIKESILVIHVCVVRTKLCNFKLNQTAISRKKETN